MGRWSQLDFEPPGEKRPAADAHDCARAGGVTGRERGRYAALAGMTAPGHPAVATARGLYVLRDWPGVVAALSTVDVAAPEVAGGWLLLGLAHARLGDAEAAEHAFEQATRACPNDLFTGCAHAAFLLHHARDVEAMELLQSCVPASGGVVEPKRAGDDPPGEGAATGAGTGARLQAARLKAAVEEMLGACEWAEGRRRLLAGEAEDAVERFAASGRRFIAARESRMAACRVLAARLGAVYVGQVVSLVAAGRTDAALQLYGQMRPAEVRFTDSLERFARGLHALCALLSRMNDDERHAVSEDLTGVIRRTGMYVALWDGSQPVSITWEVLSVEC
jgi:hypothetical protein